MVSTVAGKFKAKVVNVYTFNWQPKTNRWLVVRFVVSLLDGPIA